MFVLIYLGAIVTANLTVTYFGPPSVILVGFLLVGLDLTARDRLHDAWHGRQLPLRMTALIAVGSLLSWLLNRNAGPIALASFVAFGAAGIADALVYHGLRRRAWFERVNGSNVVAAAVDSVVFVALAFGPLFLLMIVQFVAKVAGGAAWAWVIGQRRRATA